MNNYACTTQVPNALFDQRMRDLTLSELKVLLLVIRQTWGWVADKSGRRKTRDWLSCSRIEARTGLSKRAISMAIEALVKRGLLVVTSGRGDILISARDRRGKTRLYCQFRYPQGHPQSVATSASVADVDRQTVRMTKPTLTKPSNYGERPVSEILENAVHPRLWERLNRNSPFSEEVNRTG